jgi:hypothetical protein
MEFCGMGGRETETNKAEAIRRVLKQLGRLTPTRQVVRHLSSEGVGVTAQQVSNQKAKLAKLGDEDLRASVLKKVKALVDELGSTEVLRRALDDLEELTRRRGA